MTAQGTSTTTIHISWTDLISHEVADGYRVWVSDGKTDVKAVASQRQYDVADLTPFTKYTVGVRTCYDDQCSSSNNATAYTLPSGESILMLTIVL